MLTEEGRVVAIETDALWVETIRQSTCGSCSANKGCGHSLLNKISDGKRSYIRVLPGGQILDGYKIDDRIRFSIPEEVILRGSFIAYLLPVMCMMAAAFGAVALFEGNEDALAAVGAIVGLLAGFILVRWHAVTHQGDPDFQPVLLQKLGDDASAVQVL